MRLVTSRESLSVAVQGVVDPGDDLIETSTVDGLTVLVQRREVDADPGDPTLQSVTDQADRVGEVVTVLQTQL